MHFTGRFALVFWIVVVGSANLHINTILLMSKSPFKCIARSVAMWSKRARHFTFTKYHSRSTAKQCVAATRREYKEFESFLVQFISILTEISKYIAQKHMWWLYTRIALLSANPFNQKELLLVYI